MTPPIDLFRGPTKRAVLAALAAADGPIFAADLCERVYGDRSPANRTTLRNLVVQMRPRLEACGWTIRGRKDLGVNAYHLVLTVL